MSVIHIPRRPEIGIRQLLMLGVLFLALLVVFLRLWFLQVVKSAELTERSVTFGYDTVPIASPRGLIVDRNGTLLAGVHSVLVVTVVPDVMKRNPDVLSRVSALIGVPVEKLNQKLALDQTKPFLPRPICAGVSVDVATKLVESTDEFPGVDVESQPIRYYPDDTNFAHVLGYVWTPSERDVARLAKQDIKPQAYVGKSGLEAIYEKELMGQPGTEEIEIDAKKRPVGKHRLRDNPVPGDKVMLSLDSDLQKLAMQELQAIQKDSPSSAGAVVAVDPKTGEILCLASNPTYSTDVFLKGIKSSDYEDLMRNPLNPMLNRAIAGTYPPGSTFKIVSTLASAKAGTFSLSRAVNCPGYYEVGNKRVKCLGHHGAIRYEQALTKSCNTYFADLAVRTGPENLKAEALEVGLGQRAGIDLPGEGKAIVPTEDWLRARQKTPEGKKPAWYPGDTVNMGIGQGDLSVTPLQMADLAALVANQGICYRPHLAKAFYDSASGNATRQVQPEELWHTDVPADVWQDLKNAMIQVIEGGTAKRAQIDGVTWAGKTGSSQHSGPNGKTHSWFVGFAPADNPRIAICAVVENGGHGGEVSAPIAAAVVKRYLEEVGALSKPASVAARVFPAASAHSALFASFTAR